MLNHFPPCRVPTYRVYGVPVLMLVRKSFPSRALPRTIRPCLGTGDWIKKAKVRRMAVVSATWRVGAKPMSDLAPLKSLGTEALGPDPNPRDKCDVRSPSI